MSASASAAQTAPAPSTLAPAGAAKWTGKELLYGGSIGHYPAVVYQPDVVVIGGGANAIRGVSSNKLTWTVDGHAQGVAQLHVGSLMLATTLASGRVAKLAPAGPDVQVTLVPASLTDIVRDGTLKAKTPVPLTGPLVLDPGFRTCVRQQLGGGSARLPATFASPGIARGSEGPSTPTGQGTSGPRSAFKLTPICCSGGIGVHIGYDSEYGRLSAAVQLIVSKPSVTYSIDISNAHLQSASVKLPGRAPSVITFSAPPSSPMVT